jgi:hypothetical protein
MRAGHRSFVAPGLGSLCLLLLTLGWATEQTEAFHVNGFIPMQAGAKHGNQPYTSVCGWQTWESLALCHFQSKSSHSTLTSGKRRGALSRLKASFVAPAMGPGNLLARVAEVGLKLKLRSHDVVQVNIDSSAAELLRGSVQGVTVRGTLWSSPLLLTCRSLEATVGETSVALDALARGQIDLKKPAIGTCNVIFNGGARIFVLSHIEQTCFLVYC